MSSRRKLVTLWFIFIGIYLLIAVSAGYVIFKDRFVSMNTVMTVIIPPLLVTLNFAMIIIVYSVCRHLKKLLE